METSAIKKWGHSQGMIIPKTALYALQWQQDDKVILRVEDKKLIIEQAPKIQRKNIKELFQDFNIANYTPGEIDWGKPAGDEVW